MVAQARMTNLSECISELSTHTLQQHELSSAWHLNMYNEEAYSWLTLCPLERPSDGDFQLLIGTVWSLHRCNFLNPTSKKLCCSICLLFGVFVWLFSASEAEL